MKNVVLSTVAVLFGLVMSPVAGAQQANGDITPVTHTLAQMPFEWPQDAKQARLVTKDGVLRLLNEFNSLADVPYRKNIDTKGFTFAPLEDGELHLIAVTNDPETGWFQYLSVVSCHGMSCTLATIDSAPPIDLNRQVIDLQGSGKYQIIRKECICVNGEREEGDRVFVYEVSGNRVEDQSAKYPQFYREKVLPDLTKKMQKTVPNDLNSEEAMGALNAKLLYAQHDVERRVFGDRLAGLSDARQWEQATDDDIKALAIQTFEKIDSPDADAGLKRMSQSESKYIGQRAQEALARKASKAAPQ